MTTDPGIQRIHDQSRESARVITALAQDQAGVLLDMALRIEACLRRKGRLLTCGNGGSAGDAQHLAAELSGRFYLERPGLAAVALTTNTSALTAIANDYSYDEVFSRQLEGLAQRGDVLLALTTSGTSANVLRAVEKARELGLEVLGLTGAKGEAFAQQCDAAVVVPSRDTPRIQEGHVFAGHMICQLVEAQLFGSP